MNGAGVNSLAAGCLLMFLCGCVEASKLLHGSNGGKHPVLAKLPFGESAEDVQQFAFAKHFQDHMVLQQAPARANIYGFSPDIGQAVTLQLTSSQPPVKYDTKVSQGPQPGVGVWNFPLDPLKANTTVNITVTSGGVSLNLTDILVGDVWICSGQSNMEFTVPQMFDAAAELADAHNYPRIRIMTVGNDASPTPLYDVRSIMEAWTLPNNVTLAGPIWGYFSAVCWLYGKALHKALGYPIGLVSSDFGGTPIAAWSPPQALRRCNITSESYDQPASHKSHNEFDGRLTGPSNNSVLWNAMINPLTGMTIKGVLWYQGENDASGVKLGRYKCAFTSLITEWRSIFHNASNGQTDPVFPFGFVQLAPNRPSQTLVRGFADMRWHQTADHGYVPNADMVNVFMAVTLDLPDFGKKKLHDLGGIHPRDKKDVAYRLALSGLSVAYGWKEMFQGPLPETIDFVPGGLVVSYGNRWTLDIRTTSGFEVMCVVGKNQTWIPINITASNDTAITLAPICSTVQQTTQIRYAWRESPCEFMKCAVYETISGLPGPSFIYHLPKNNTGEAHFHSGGKQYIINDDRHSAVH